MPTIFDLETEPTEKRKPPITPTAMTSVQRASYLGKPAKTGRTIFDIEEKPEITGRSIFDVEEKPPVLPPPEILPPGIHLFEKPAPAIQPFWTPPERAKGPERILKEYAEREIPAPDVLRGLKTHLFNTGDTLSWIWNYRKYEADYVDPLTGKPLKKPEDYNANIEGYKEQIKLSWSKAKPELETATEDISNFAAMVAIMYLGATALKAVPDIWKYYTAKKVVEEIPMTELRGARMAVHPDKWRIERPTPKQTYIANWFNSLDRTDQIDILNSHKSIYYIPRGKGFVMTSKTYPGKYLGPEYETLALPGPGTTATTTQGTYEIVKGHPLGKPAFSQAEILEKKQYENWLKTQAGYMAPREEIAPAAGPPIVTPPEVTAPLGVKPEVTPPVEKKTIFDIIEPAVALPEPKKALEKVNFAELKVGDVVTHREGANARTKHNWTIHRIIKDKEGMPSRIFVRDESGQPLKYAWSRLQWEEAIYRVGKAEAPVVAPLAKVTKPPEEPIPTIIGLGELKGELQRAIERDLTEPEKEVKQVGAISGETIPKGTATINESEISETMGIKQEVIDSIKKRLQGQIASGKILTAAEKINGVEFILFSQMANGRRNVFKIAGPYKGSYTTLEIVKSQAVKGIKPEVTPPTEVKPETISNLVPPEFQKVVSIRPDLPYTSSKYYISGSGQRHAIIGIKDIPLGKAKAVILHEVGHHITDVEGTYFLEIMQKNESLAKELDAWKWAILNAQKYGANIKDIKELLPKGYWNIIQSGKLIEVTPPITPPEVTPKYEIHTTARRGISQFDNEHKGKIHRAVNDISKIFGKDIIEKANILFIPTNKTVTIQQTGKDVQAYTLGKGDRRIYIRTDVHPERGVIVHEIAHILRDNDLIPKVSAWNEAQAEAFMKVVYPKVISRYVPDSLLKQEIKSLEILAKPEVTPAKIAEPTVVLRPPTETEKLESKVELIIKQKGIMYARDMKIETHKDVADIFYELKNADREKLFILNLDADSRIINVENVSIGILNSISFHPREALKNSILCGAKIIQPVHNHPSGKTEASANDVEMLKDLTKVASRLGIKTNPGIIINRTEYGYFDKTGRMYSVPYKPEKGIKEIPLVEIETREKPSSLSGELVTAPEIVVKISKSIVNWEKPTLVALYVDTTFRTTGIFVIGHSLTNTRKIINAVVKNGFLTNSEAVVLSTNMDSSKTDTVMSLRVIVDGIRKSNIGVIDVIESKFKEPGEFISFKENKLFPGLAEPRVEYRVSEPEPAKIKVGELIDELQRAVEVGEFGERRALRKAFFAGKESGKIEASMKYKDFLKRAKERKELALETKASIKNINRLLGMKGIHYDYQPLIDAIKEKFEFIPRAKKTLFERAETKKFIEREQEAGHPVDMPEKVLDLLGKTNVRQITLEELRGLKEEIHHLVHLGRFKNKLLKIRYEKGLDALANEIGSEITKGKPIMPAEIKIGVVDEESWLKKFHRSLMRQERQIEKIGGMGINTRTFRSIWEPIDNAENQNIIAKNKRLDEIVAFVNQNKIDMLKMAKEKMKINDRVSLTSGEKIWAYLNTLNERNLKHLMEGNGFTSKDIEDVKNSMTPQEKKIADWALKMMDQYKEINAIYRRIKGKDMGKEEMYAPILIDWEASGIDYEPSIVEDILSKFSQKKVTLQKGFTKERVGGLQPIILDFWGNLIKHIRAVERYKAYALAERDVGRLISHPQVKNAILQAYPKDGQRLYKDLRQWFEDAIGNPTYTRRDPVTKFLGFVRRNSAIGLLGANILTILRQTISYSNAAALVNPVWMMRGTTEFLTNPISTQAKVFEKAPQHRFRFVEKDIAEQIERAGRKEFMTKGQKFFASVMKGIRFSDRETVVACWWSAYKKELFRTGDEAKAIRYADFVIRRTQPMTRRIDLSSLYRSRDELTKALTMFQNQPNQIYDFVVHDMWRAYKAGKISKLDLAWMFIFTIVAPSFLYSFTRRGRLPKPKEMITDILLYPLITIPGARELNFVLANKLEGRRFYGSGLNLPPLLFLEAAGKTIAAKKPSTMLKYGIQTGAYLFGIPYLQPQRTLQGIIDLATGETKDLRRLIWSKSALKEETGGIPKLPRLPSLSKMK